MGSDSQRIAAYLGDEASLLTDLFGQGGYTIEVLDRDRCLLRSSVAEATFAYENRDRWVVSAITPLTLPENLRDLIPSHMWAPFTDQPQSVGSKGPLDAARVRSELRLVEQIVRAEQDRPGTLRDWAFFTWGYNCSYTDEVSASFRDRWRRRFLGKLIGVDAGVGDVT